MKLTTITLSLLSTLALADSDCVDVFRIEFTPPVQKGNSTLHYCMEPNNKQEIKGAQLSLQFCDKSNNPQSAQAFWFDHVSFPSKTVLRSYLDPTLCVDDDNVSGEQLRLLKCDKDRASGRNFKFDNGEKEKWTCLHVEDRKKGNNWLWAPVVSQKCVRPNWFKKVPWNQQWSLNTIRGQCLRPKNIQEISRRRR